MNTGSRWTLKEIAIAFGFWVAAIILFLGLLWKIQLFKDLFK